MLYPESEIIHFQKLQSATGLISSTSDSKLNLHLTDFDYKELAGRYMCRVEITNKSGESRYCSAHKDISKVERCLTLNIDLLPRKAEAIGSSSELIHIEPGSTKRLLINCSMHVFMTSALYNLKSLILLRAAANESEFKEVASISTEYKHVLVKDEDAVGGGVICSKRKSYLYVEWPYPIYEMAGTYKCEVHGISKLGQPKNCSTTAVVSSSEISLKSLHQLQRLSLLENMRLQDAYNKYNEKANRIKDIAYQFLNLSITETKMPANMIISTVAEYYKKNLNKVMKTLFLRRSDRFYGHRYYLSKMASVVFNKKNHATCFDYGGYLAEINDDEELNFVRRFLKDYTEIGLSILISGTYQADERVYLYERSANAYNRYEGDVVTYLPWSKGQPDGRDRHHCLHLGFNGSDWFFYDQKCALYRMRPSLSFLCDVDEQSVPFYK